MYFEINANENGIFLVCDNEEDAATLYYKQPKEIQNRLKWACFGGYMNAFSIHGDETLTINDVSIIK